MSHDTILATTSEGILTVTLNRPERLNAWNTAMRKRLIEVLDDAGRNDAIRAVVITGAGGRAFCAGQDLNEATGFDADRAEIWIDEFADLYRAVRALEKPVVAAINGVAAGSAFQFALLTDIRIGHLDVRMGQPEINSGIASITGPWIMKEVLGLSRTIELTLTGRLLDAEEALRLGVLHHVVPRDIVMDKAQEIARELAAKPQTAMRLIKRRFFEVLEPGLRDAVAAAKRHHRESFTSGEPQKTTTDFLAARGGVRRG
ncbi:MAG: enoyl-CoA hydratase/isomerase family protein [Rhodobiaceae bacterium]|nr:enoyl-CoA hydratase/isomerase family protein [Rhodobiaceae bacterium]MCC0042084.1 enoyl-CoA hydratase/isomerase family protein [Rhodobiaceae bacterium]